MTNSSQHSTPTSPPAGHIDCGIQVDIPNDSIESLRNLIEVYSSRLSEETIKQFYEICQGDLSWTQIQLDEYLQHTHHQSSIPTLRQLSFNALNQWDNEIKHSNPSFDTISIGDLLKDINDDEVFEEFHLHETETNNQSIEFNEKMQMIIPWPLINSLQDLYGELPSLNSFSSNNNGMVLPLDDELSLGVYQSITKILRCIEYSSKYIEKSNDGKEIDQRE